MTKTTKTYFMKTVTTLLILVLTFLNISSFGYGPCEVNLDHSTNFKQTLSQVITVQLETHTDLILVDHHQESTDESKTESHSCHLGHCSFALPISFVFMPIISFDTFNPISFPYNSAELMSKRRPPKA